MTQEEMTTILSTIETARTVCYDKVLAIEKAHEAACKRETAPFEEERDRLFDQLTGEKVRCLAQADWLPFSPRDFITNGSGDFYEVRKWHLDFSLDSRIEVRCHAYPIRKSGTLARCDTTLYQYQNYRKADLSEDLRLRRCLKLRLRRRLEGGD